MKKLTRIIVSSLLISIIVVGLLFAFVGCNKEEPIKVKVIDIPLTENEQYGMIFPKANTELLGYANALLGELKTSGELDKIIASFENGSNSWSYKSPTKKPTDNVISVCTNAFFEPFEYFVDNNENIFSGTDIYLAYLLTEKVSAIKGEKYTLYIESIDFDDICGCIATWEFDMGIAAITINADRALSVNFSDYYYESYQVVITKEDDTTFNECKSDEDVKNLLKSFDKSFTVGVQKSTTGAAFLKGDSEKEIEGYTNLSIKEFMCGDDAVEALKEGKINAVILDATPAKALAAK